MPSNQLNSNSNKIIVGNPLVKKGVASSSIPTDLITFQLDQTCVLVKPTQHYQDALDIAQKEFFYELSNVPRERLAFSIIENGNGDRRKLRISEGAWSTLVSKLPQGSIIHITIRPDPEAKAPPPQYLEVPNGPQTTLGLRHSRSDSGISSHPHSTKNNGMFSWLGSGK
ncbi:hypothetical protein JR316_0001944 [Psilocybe cubensis]|uniref:Uncharacterized protein n=2 Tax=Psilocybe cubensis TaxID=181762 RepID=A0ACB8HB61_PSICU|nr:hypothetical protein JR316_0001944 [Psilocybe cubensis]KAH9485038.1 hypothetical protein JR316_0001944 [Psilocybe cubensis]